MAVSFRIDQQSRPQVSEDQSRHDLVPDQAISLVAVSPANGPDVLYQWEIIDRVGTTQELEANEGPVVTIAGPSTQPFAFFIEMRVYINGVFAGSARRIASARTAGKQLRVPVFGETADPTSKLSAPKAAASTDNALYENLAGQTYDYNWRGWSQWAYEITLAVENSGGNGGGSGSGEPIVMSGYYDQSLYPNALGFSDGYCTRSNGNTDYHQLSVDARPPGATAWIRYASADEVPEAPRRIYCDNYAGVYPGPPLNRNVHEYGTIAVDTYTALTFIGLEVPNRPVSASDSIAVRLHNTGPSPVTLPHLTTQPDSVTAPFKTPDGAAYVLASFAEATATFDHLSNVWVLSAAAAAAPGGGSGGSAEGVWSIQANPNYPDLLEQSFSLDPGLSITYAKTGGAVPAFPWTGYRLELTLPDPRSNEYPGRRMAYIDIGGQAGSQVIRLTCSTPGSFSEGQYHSINFVEMNVPWGGIEVSWYPDPDPSQRRWRVTRRMDAPSGTEEYESRISQLEGKVGSIEYGAQVTSTDRVVSALGSAQAPVSFNNQRLVSLDEPIDWQDAATRGFVESAIASIPGGGGTGGAGGWSRVANINFTQLSPETINANGLISIEGVPFEMINVDSAASVSINSAGLQLQSNTVAAQLYYAQASTAPTLSINVADIAPDFVLGQSELRAWILGGSNGDKDHEVLVFSLARRPWVGGVGNQPTWLFAIGAYDGSNPHNGCYATQGTGSPSLRTDVNFTAETIANDPARSVWGLHWKDIGAVDYYYKTVTASDAEPNDDVAKFSNMELGAVLREATTERLGSPSGYQPTLVKIKDAFNMTKASDLSLNLAMSNFNTTGHCLATVKRLVIEVKI